MNNKEKVIKEFFDPKNDHLTVREFRRKVALFEEVGDKELRDKYEELIMAVSNKFPEETRHQTALRYIKERGSSSNKSGAKQDNQHYLRWK